MIQTPVIVTFANQKGGVGKTTLCATFANYLVTMGVRVMVIDCDFQHSIVQSRSVDVNKYGEDKIPYEVSGFDANDKPAIDGLIDKLRNEPSIDVVLMDSPASLKAAGLVTMFINSDYIIVPFHYDVTTVPSTASFLIFIDRLRQVMGKRMTAKLIMVPNMNDSRVGKKAELVMWENTRKTFSNYGIVTGKIAKRADMERISTMADMDMQSSIVKPVFTEIYKDIFGTDEPYRPIELTDIQLTKQKMPAKKAETDSEKEEPAEEAHTDYTEDITSQNTTDEDDKDKRAESYPEETNET